MLPKSGHPEASGIGQLMDKPLIVPKKEQLSQELYQEITERLKDFPIATVYESLVDALYLIDAEMCYGVVNDYPIGEQDKSIKKIIRENR